MGVCGVRLPRQRAWRPSIEAYRFGGWCRSRSDGPRAVAGEARGKSVSSGAFSASRWHDALQRGYHIGLARSRSTSPDLEPLPGDDDGATRMGWSGRQVLGRAAAVIKKRRRVPGKFGADVDDADGRRLDVVPQDGAISVGGRACQWASSLRRPSLWQWKLRRAGLDVDVAAVSARPRPLDAGGQCPRRSAQKDA